MKYGVSIPNFGEAFAVRTLAEMAREAEAAVEPYVQAGATWWLDDVSPWAFGWNGQGAWPTAAMRERVRRGPPMGAAAA
jgi:hypothetical protein